MLPWLLTLRIENSQAVSYKVKIALDISTVYNICLIFAPKLCGVRYCKSEALSAVILTIKGKLRFPVY